MSLTGYRPFSATTQEQFILFPCRRSCEEDGCFSAKKNSDDNVVITLEALNSGDVFMYRHIDSELGVWSTVESKAHLYYPEYKEGELVQAYCHEKEFWGDYFVKRKNKIWCATKGSNCQYAPTYTLHAVTDPNDVVANQSVSRQVAAYDMRSQEWRTKQLQKANLDPTKGHVV